MANTTDTSTTFRIFAAIAAILLLGAAALAYLQTAGAGRGSASDWSQLESHSTEVQDGRRMVDALADSVATVNARIEAVLGLTEEMLSRSGSTDTVLQFQYRAAQIGTNATTLLANQDASAAMQKMIEDAAYLRTVETALAGGETELDVRPLNAEGQEVVIVPLQSHLADIDGALERINAGIAAVEDLANAQTRLAAVSTRLGVALLMIIVLISLNGKSSKFETTAKVQAEQNERNQQAILRLLDEMGSLADGDLTVEATVTEDITGTIADSFNFAIEELRKLVATVNETAIMVDSAAKQTESTATHLAKAADNQGREINAATESIVSMAASIEEVSGNAERSSDVARHSVEVAHKGGEAVRRTIDGMNTIRETIQDTSKRIKRLGESSQEIGNIVELINDIAEQTNILALNASIQASMAGEAGRGFAVVADEVQRLAERSTNATKQIEVLVRTIQADTNEAVVSMERSTTDVVGGALLAENAGAALDEIEQVSNQIASLVQNISSSARQQAGSAADVTRRTTRLREISEQTGKATTATAAAIAKLSELASQLRMTVAGFTLPNEALQARTLSTSSSNAMAAKTGGQVKAG